MMKQKTRLSFDSDINKNYGSFQKVASKSNPKLVLMIYDTKGDVVLEKEFSSKERVEFKKWL